jgi:hypothetical protein
MSTPSASEMRKPLISNRLINARSAAVPSPAAISSAPTSLPYARFVGATRPIVGAGL